MLLWLMRIILFLPCMLMHPTRIKGKKNLPKGKAILCCNHRSNWDAVLFNLRICSKPRFLSKKELFQSKFMNWFMRGIGAFPIDRQANDITAIKTCMKYLKEGKKLFIFPEGTRLVNDDEILGEVKSGLALIAIKTQTPIVPIWIKSRPKFFRSSVYYIGKPYELSDFYGKKLDEQTLAEADRIVREKMLEVRENNLPKKKAKKQKGQKKEKK